MTFTVQKRRSPALRTPSTCPQRPSRGGRRTLIKYTTLKRATVAAKAGANRVRLASVVRTLAPGRYRVLLAARSADGRVTGEQSIKLLVAKRRAG